MAFFTLMLGAAALYFLFGRKSFFKDNNKTLGPGKQLGYHHVGSLMGRKVRLEPGDHSDVRDRALSINSQRPEMLSTGYGEDYQNAHRPGLLQHGAMRSAGNYTNY